MFNVMIADDHAVVRRGIRQILEETPDFRGTGEASNAEDLIGKLGKGKWDIVILDLNMPGRSGLDVLKDLRKRWPRLPVLVLSMHDERQFAVRVIKAGASGYVNKDSATDEMVQALRKVMTGRKYISSRVAETLAADLQRMSPDRMHEGLSDREFEVLCLIASGKTVSQIAVKLKLSVKTVSTYRQRILEKMSMTTNAELTRYALEKKLVE
ncbi:MAG TPA: response regulator transcription factor [Bacteroidota bacterium]